MDESAKRVLYGIIAALISVVVHLLFLGLADQIPVGGLPFLKRTEPQQPRRVMVQSIDIRERVFGRPRIDTIDLTREAAELLRETLAEGKPLKELQHQPDLASPLKPELQIKGLGENIVLPDPSPSAPPTMPSAPRPAIVEIDADRLAPEQIADDRRVTAKLPRKTSDAKSIPSLYHGEEWSPGSAGALAVGLRLSRPPAPPDLSQLPPEEGDTSEHPDDMTTAKLTPTTDLPEIPTATAGDSTRERPESIDELVTFRMAVYRAEDNSGFFRIDIAPNPRSDRLRAIPKDVLFLIDRSNSITPPKLAVFKETVANALAYLNPRDRFNVVSFYREAEGLFDGYVPVNKDNLNQAARYVRNLIRGGLTDVYAGIAPFVGEDKDHPDRPLTVFLFTDGQSTVEDKLDNETLIRKVVAINRHNVSIYATSCGENANRFLLDLLAYSNRGLPLHRDRLEDFQASIARLVSAHSDIIVADIDYNITGGLGGEIYPRKLPHLYRGDTLSVYGQFPSGTREIAIQLTGYSADGQLSDLVYRADVRRAAPAGSELAYDWVAQKIFHLIVQNTLNPSPAITSELQYLKKKYKLEIPYF
jgi:Mg-chelatase subunit ChlD